MSLAETAPMLNCMLATWRFDSRQEPMLFHEPKGRVTEFFEIGASSSDMKKNALCSQ